MRILNKRAKRDFQILEQLEAGIALLGQEVKSLSLGRGDISRAYVKIINGQVYLINASIPALDGGSSAGYDPARSRKLLLKKSEIVSILTELKQQRLTLIPLSIYNKGRLVKLKIALARIKRTFEKKEALKKKDIEREIARELKV